MPGMAAHFDRAMISVRTLWGRRSFRRRSWIMDSGAFTELSTYGSYQTSVKEYAEMIRYWSGRSLVAAVTQDYMCEDFIIKKTGLSVKEHQQMTVDRYDSLMSLSLPTYLMPVLQGYEPQEYVD